MTPVEKKIIHDLIEYFDVVRGSIRINFKDDGDIEIFPTPKIKLSEFCNEAGIDNVEAIIYNIARIIKID